MLYKGLVLLHSLSIFCMIYLWSLIESYSHTHTAVSVCLCLTDECLRVKIEIYCRCQITLVALVLSLHPFLSLSQSHLSAVNPISCHSDPLTASRLRGTGFTPGIFMQTQTSQHQTLTNHSISQSNRTTGRVPTTRHRATHSATL